MRNYRDELIQQNIDCFYHELPLEKKQSYLDTLTSFCKKHDVKTLHVIEIEDHFFDTQLRNLCKELQIEIKTHQSPLFLTSHDQFSTYLSSTKKPFMKTFYEQQRKRLNILMEQSKPQGGKWSFDEDNRKKLPKPSRFHL